MTTEEERKLSATAERFSRRFSLAEIHLATEDFSEARLIGKGGFGKVYKGQIDDGQQTVAMKRLAPNSNQGEGEFLMEIETLSKLRHVNLVSLIGYCDESGEMILVYEYIPRGTLSDHIYEISPTSLTWKQRLCLCIGAGRGLDYLHTGWSNSIIHRDVKSTNILVDENFTAKVSDFGLAKHLTSSDSSFHVSTLVKGSFGYLDPSYFRTGRLTRNSDTYAFGVVLLEVLSARPAVDPTLANHGGSLVIWAQEKIRKGKVDQIAASNLREEITTDCLKTFVGVAKRCLHHEPQKRPSMCEAVIQLQLASKQQDKKASTHRPSRFLPFLNRAKSSGNRATGTTKKDKEIPATQEEALKEEQTFCNLPVAVSAIPIQELKHITNNFSSECAIGVGSNGSVYRGALKSGQVAAIKKLRICSQTDEEFLQQVSLVSSLQHKNVAKLLGYCVHGGQRFLAYEFAPNGSLHDILHGHSEVSKAVSWGQRVKIVIGAAQGLEYIHHRGHIHNNIRSNNVLVYNDQVVKLADFGLSVRSTLKHLYHITDYDPFCLDRPQEYHSPEYISNGEVSWRSDVYSFGLVLLELLTGSALVDYAQPSGRRHILTWAMPKLLKYEAEDILDPRLNGDYPPKAVAKMSAIAVSCLHHNALSRPDMSSVVRQLCPLLDHCSARDTQNL